MKTTITYAYLSRAGCVVQGEYPVAQGESEQDAVARLRSDFSASGRVLLEVAGEPAGVVPPAVASSFVRFGVLSLSHWSDMARGAGAADLIPA